MGAMLGCWTQHAGWPRTELRWPVEPVSCLDLERFGRAEGADAVLAALRPACPVSETVHVTLQSNVLCGCVLTPLSH